MHKHSIIQVRTNSIKRKTGSEGGTGRNPASALPPLIFMKNT